MNKFPYFYEDGVENYVLWYGNKDATKSEKYNVISQQEKLKQFDLIVFENPEMYQSVKGIPHLQILARKININRERSILF